MRMAINKADGDNLRKSVPKGPQGAYELALHLLSPATPTWTPPVLTCSALDMARVSTIWATVLGSPPEKLSAHR
jgi:LAO/AO transport system kinase